MHKIDHFAIGATSLDAGVDALEPTLGVRVPRWQQTYVNEYAQLCDAVRQ